jgi:hypothetical protein
LKNPLGNFKKSFSDIQPAPSNSCCTTTKVHVTPSGYRSGASSGRGVEWRKTVEKARRDSTPLELTFTLKPVVQHLIKQAAIWSETAPRRLSQTLNFNRHWMTGGEPVYLTAWVKNNDGLTIVLIDGGVHYSRRIPDKAVSGEAVTKPRSRNRQNNSPTLKVLTGLKRELSKPPKRTKAPKNVEKEYNDNFSNWRYFRYYGV